jgi:YVTN family beta-propeller protein
MSRRPFAPRYWRTLRGGSLAWSVPAAGRDRTGYTFWQRYWASLTLTDLSARRQVSISANGARVRSSLDGYHSGRADSPPSAGGPDLLDSAQDGTQRVRPERFRGLAPVAAALAVIAVAAGLTLVVSKPGEPLARPTANQSAPASLADPTVATTITVRGTPTDIQVAPNGKFAYITSQNPDVIIVLDTATDRVSKTIPISQGPPQYVSFSPGGQTAYVSVYNDSGSVHLIAFIDTAIGTVTATVQVNNDSPGPSAASPNGRYLYVPNHNMSMTDPNGRIIDVIDTAQKRVVDSISVPLSPHWIVFGAGGRYLYVSDYMSSVVTVLNPSNNRIVKEIPVGETPYGEAISPDGSTLAVTSYDGNFVSFIDTATDKVVKAVDVGTNPQACAYAPDGRHLYVVNNVSGTVTVIDTADYATRTVRVGSAPTSIAVLPDGRQAYVANENGGSIDVLNIAELGQRGDRRRSVQQETTDRRDIRMRIPD